jgi:hypothetical protein
MRRRRNDGLVQNGFPNASPGGACRLPDSRQNVRDEEAILPLYPDLEPPSPIGIIDGSVFGVRKWMKPYIWQARL